MYEATLKLECSKPELDKQSLEPDIKNDDTVETQLNATNDTLEISYKKQEVELLESRDKFVYIHSEHARRG